MFWVWQADGNGVWITATDRYEAAAKFRADAPSLFERAVFVGSKDGTYQVWL